MLISANIVQAFVRSIGQPNPPSDAGGQARGARSTRSGEGHGSVAKPIESRGVVLPPIEPATASAANMPTIDFLSVRMAVLAFEACA